MKKELELDIVNKHFELEGMLYRRHMNTIGLLDQFQHVTLGQYRFEYGGRIGLAQRKLRELEQEARKYKYSCKTSELEQEASSRKIIIAQMKIHRLKRVFGYLSKYIADSLSYLQTQSNQLRMVLTTKGLTPERIQQFDHFQADETKVDEQCSICMEDFEVGRNMMRLDCDGRHVFCQVCIEGWFADHNTCPICRHLF